MRTSRKTNDTDALRIDMPLRRVPPCEPYRLLRILQILDIFRIVAVFRNAILNQNASHADRVEPIAHLGSFDIVGKANIRPTGKNQRSSATILGRIG